MKKFLGKGILFLVIFGVILCILDYVSMWRKWDEVLARWTCSEDYTNEAGREIVPLIEKVREEDGTTKLILGDSVCKQLFNGGGDDLQQYNTDISIVGSNGAITMAGQYVFAREYLENHPEATDIYLFILPGSLRRTFDRNLGYQYVVLPLCETGTLKMMDADTIKEMKDVYGAFALNRKFVRAIRKSSVNEKIWLNILKNNKKGYYLQNGMDLADRYILKTYNMCLEKGVNFHCHPCPMSIEHKEEWEETKEQYKSSIMAQYYPHFMEEVKFYSSEEFGDTIHFGGAFESRDNFNAKIIECYSDIGLLEYLHFK